MKSVHRAQGILPKQGERRECNKGGPLGHGNFSGMVCNRPACEGGVIMGVAVVRAGSQHTRGSLPAFS